MDQIVVNITDVPDIQLGDVVTLIGNDGKIGRRVERFYSEAP